MSRQPWTVATLCLYQLKGRPTVKKEGQAGRNGGAYYCFEVEAKSLVRDWNFIDD